MNWYLVKFVFQIMNGAKSTVQFDEQLRLVRADEAEWALEKANVLGWLEQSSFKSGYGSQVAWKFAGIADIQNINRLYDGAQLHGNTVEPECMLAYLKTMEVNRAKAVQLLKEENA